MRIYHYIAGIIVLLLVSCNKELLVREAPDFNVALESSTYSVGDEVIFHLSGNADMISFYSGEVGNDYTYKDGRVVETADDDVILSFSSAVADNENRDGPSQPDQLTVLISTDFDGNYESVASVQAASWTDITDRFTLGANETFIPSGGVNVSDLVSAGEPLYVAFRYMTKPQEENGLVRTWMIESFLLSSTHQLNGANVPFSNQLFAGFSIVDEDPENAPARALTTNTRITLRGNEYKHPDDPIFNPDNPIFDPDNPIYDPLSPEYDPDAELQEFVPYDPNDPYNDPQREHWAVSRVFDTGRIDLGPDLAVGIRGRRNDALTEYRHVYNEPGTYSVYFVAANNTIDNENIVIKEVSVTIVP